jgi:hypothetical protein
MRICSLAVDIGLENKLSIILNKIRGNSAAQEQLISGRLPGIPVIGAIPSAINYR